MKVIELSIDNKVRIDEQLSCCIGNFDGFHIGHQKLIESAIVFAKNNNCKSAIITFDINPANINGYKVMNLLTLNQKIELAASFKVDYLVLIKFDQKLKSLSSQQFNTFLKENFNIVNIVCGFDFKYGFQGSGNYNDLKRDFLNVEVIESVTYLDEKISSTRIRNLLNNGEISVANKILGYDYFLEGVVIHGIKLGRVLGYPTANIKILDNKCILKKGVYKAYTIIEGVKYIALVNIGVNPTVQNDNNLRIEAHILNFNQQIYDEKLKFYFLEFIRDEKKFESKEKLTEQIRKDILGVLNE